MSTHTQLAILVSILATSACDDPLKEPQRIEQNRVLGARVEALADSTRASLLPGESARIRWLVADPQPVRRLGWAFGVCPAVMVSSGLPRCGGPVFAQAISSEPRPVEPSFELAVPPPESLGGFEQLVILGVICADGQPATPARGCAGAGVESTLVDFYVSLASTGEPNHNPSLASAELSWDGAPWTAPPAELLAEASCTGAPSDVPRVGRGSKGHAVRIILAESDREPLASANPLDPPRETLSLSHFATGGELERAYSILEPSSALAPVDVTWDAPATALTEGSLVRFYFVVRDLRGGVDWTERVVCVEP